MTRQKTAGRDLPHQLAILFGLLGIVIIEGFMDFGPKVFKSLDWGDGLNKLRESNRKWPS